MEKLSGLVLDVYDDAQGNVFRDIFPTYKQVPDMVKEAQLLSPEERHDLPDELFALVILDEGTVLRKLACVDSGNTALSVEYFLKTAHKLPIDAQKVAAANLIKACAWYDIEPPEQLQKIALLGKVLWAAQAPGIVKGTSQQTKAKVQVAKASGGAINPEILG